MKGEMIDGNPDSHRSDQGFLEPCLFFFSCVRVVYPLLPSRHPPYISVRFFTSCFSWTSKSPPLKILPLIIITHRLWLRWLPMVLLLTCLALLALLANATAPHRQRRSSVGGMGTVGWCSRGASISLDTSGSCSYLVCADTCSYHSRQETHWRATVLVPLWQAVFATGQLAPACTDGSCRQAGGE